MAELIATAVAAAFYALSFFTVWAFVEVSYVLIERTKQRRKLRAWTEARRR